MASQFQTVCFGSISERLSRAISRPTSIIPLVPVGIYRSGQHCPNCDGTHWDVRRSTAECATCGHALPREQAGEG